MFLPMLWAASGAVVVYAAFRVRRGPEGLRFGRYAVSAMYLVAGAAVNAFFLLRGDDYATFADGSYLSFVTDTWRDVVVPNHDIWITLLILFEASVGLLVLRGGRSAQVALTAAIVFHVLLLPFGWGFYLWSLPMIAALVALLRAELRSTARHGADDDERLVAVGDRLRERVGV